jgi:hypothetical protein
LPASNVAGAGHRLIARPLVLVPPSFFAGHGMKRQDVNLIHRLLLHRPFVSLEAFPEEWHTASFAPRSAFFIRPGFATA